MSEISLNEEQDKFVYYPWFPFAFSIGFPLTVYSYNQSAFAGIDVIRPTLIFLMVALLLTFLVRRLVANHSLANTLATIPLIAVWILGLGWQTYFTFGLWIGALYLLRNRNLPDSTIPVLNALAVGVVVLPIFAIVQVELAANEEKLQSIPYSPFVTPRTSLIAGDKPDIYHIVLDAYAGSDALAGELGFDNSKFFEQLRSLDFSVNESIIAPYNETVHTMGSVFLGEYLREGEFPIDSSSSTALRSTLGALIPNGPVHEILRKNGYTTLYTDPGHTFLRFPEDATVLRAEYLSPLNMFEMHLGEVASLDSLLPDLYQVTEEDPLILSVKSAFSHDFTEFKSPKFVYQHVLAPHTPFTVDRAGSRTTEFPGFTTTAEGDSVVLNDPELRATYIQGYLEKLRFTNDQVIGQIQQLRQLPGNKIILVHGDHGSGAHYFIENPENTCLRERFTTFLAVYADDPVIRDEFLWIPESSASAVNIYRSMFNGLLGLELEMLPGESSFVRYSAPNKLLPLERDRIPLACN